MSRWAEHGLCIVEDGVYYGRFFRASEPAPVLMSMELVSSKYDVQAGQQRILDGEHSPGFLIKADDVLYYIMLDRSTGDSCGIAAIRTDGSGLQMLYEGNCSYLSSAGDRLFFTDGRGRPVCIRTDGTDQQILTDREVYYLFALDEEWIIFQDDADDESLHLSVSPTVQIKGSQTVRLISQ